MDVFPEKTRSKIMSSIKSKNTKIEISIRKSLWRAGIRGYRLHKRIIGNPDIVFNKKKLAIFVDGDFWHGWVLKQGRVLPVNYWTPKILRTIKRDKKYTKQLKKEGWNVIRVWEHEVLKNTDKIINKIKKYTT